MTFYLKGLGRNWEASSVRKRDAKNPDIKAIFFFSCSKEEESDDSDGEIELHPLLTASLRNPITSNKKSDVPPLEPPPLPPGWTAVNPGIHS